MTCLLSLNFASDCSLCACCLPGLPFLRLLAHSELGLCSPTRLLDCHLLGLLNTGNEVLNCSSLDSCCSLVHTHSRYDSLYLNIHRPGAISLTCPRSLCNTIMGLEIQLPSLQSEDNPFYQLSHSCLAHRLSSRPNEKLNLCHWKQVACNSKLVQDSDSDFIAETL